MSKSRFFWVLLVVAVAGFLGGIAGQAVIDRAVADEQNLEGQSLKLFLSDGFITLDEIPGIGPALTIANSKGRIIISINPERGPSITLKNGRSQIRIATNDITPSIYLNDKETRRATVVTNSGIGILKGDTVVKALATQ